MLLNAAGPADHVAAEETPPVFWTYFVMAKRAHGYAHAYRRVFLVSGVWVLQLVSRVVGVREFVSRVVASVVDPGVPLHRDDFFRSVCVFSLLVLLFLFLCFCQKLCVNCVPFVIGEFLLCGCIFASGFGFLLKGNTKICL